MFNSTQDDRSMQRESPPKRGAAEPVNLKTYRNPAKTAQRPFGLARSRAHFFARISCVFKECASHRLGRWFSSFCRNKRTKKAKAVTTWIFLISTVWRPADYGVLAANCAEQGSISRNEGQYDPEFAQRNEQIFQ